MRKSAARTVSRADCTSFTATVFCTKHQESHRTIHRKYGSMYTFAASFLEGLWPFRPRKFEAITGL
ncbi:hypothetical protein SOVF_058030 [Spinacia oleracea]|nr:hypothetical protein SOVF_058030 [Spinacia oleracea]